VATANNNKNTPSIQSERLELNIDPFRKSPELEKRIKERN
jgi:hypothetical protein